MKLLSVWDSDHVEPKKIACIRISENETPPKNYIKSIPGNVEFSTDKFIYTGPYEDLPEELKSAS